MAYTEEFVEAALPLTHFDSMTVQQEREPGMPGGTTDPRKSVDPLVMMIDVRIAWEECTWLLPEQRTALMAQSMFGSDKLAAEFTEFTPAQIGRLADEGVKLLTVWLNSTHVDRAAWEEELGWDPSLAAA